MNDYIKFLIILFLSVVQVLLVITVFNWWVDPYGIFHVAEYDPKKPIWVSKQLRLAKVHRLKQLKPQGIVLGSSSSQLGIDPSHPGWDQDVYPRYNAGLPGASLYETFRFFQHSQAVSHPKQILIGLDFITFNIFYSLSNDFNESHMAVSKEGKPQDSFSNNFFLPLLSMPALKASQRKLFYVGEGTHYSNGMENPQVKARGLSNNRGAMVGTIKKVVFNLVMPPPGHRFCLYDGGGNNPNFLYLKKILEISKENGADVRLFIQPAHAFLMEVLRVLRRMEDYEKWERELIAIVEDVNNRYAESREFPLWNFGGYNSLTMTEIPPPEDPTRSMNWYFDIPHYKKSLGDLIQDRVFNFHQTGRVVPEDFGTLINSKNIDRHQKVQKLKQRDYMKTYQEDIKELTEKVNTTEKNIRLFDCNQLASRLQIKS